MVQQPDPRSPDFVSVIIPTYNRAHCLARAMRSVLAQTHGNLELIVADDASTDGTEALVRGWDDPRVVYARQATNRGAGAARNLGIEHARGSLIAFHDSDDEWLLDKLERQIATLHRAGPEVGATFGAKLICGRDESYVYGEGRVAIWPGRRFRPTTPDLSSVLVRGNVIGPPTLLVRAEIVAAIGGFDTRLPCNNDWEWMLRLSTRTGIVYTPDPVAVIHIQKDSISRRPRSSALSYLVILRKHEALFARDPRAWARHLFRAGRHLQKIGKRRGAVLCMRRAVGVAPGWPKAWLGMLHSRLSALLPETAGRTAGIARR